MTGHGHGVTEPVLAPLLALAVLAAYLEVAAGQCGPRRRGWSRWRAVSFTVGMLLVVAAVTEPPATFTGHAVRHLVLGMLAPLALVLGAPVTLALRAAPPAGRRALGRVLHARPVRLAGHPVTALLLSTGGLYLLYLTPLYVAATRHPVLHGLLDAHFLASGYLFAWLVAGPDPAPRRPGVPARLVVLGVAVAGHAVLAQLMYAGLVAVPAPVPDLRDAATVMYYGGDLAEIMLAVALLATWRPRRRVGTSGYRPLPAPAVMR